MFWNRLKIEIESYIPGKFVRPIYVWFKHSSLLWKSTACNELNQGHPFVLHFNRNWNKFHWPLISIGQFSIFVEVNPEFAVLFFILKKLILACDCCLTP